MRRRLRDYPEVERQIEVLYADISFTPEVRQQPAIIALIVARRAGEAGITDVGARLRVFDDQARAACAAADCAFRV